MEHTKYFKQLKSIGDNVITFSNVIAQIKRVPKNANDMQKVDAMVKQLIKASELLTKVSKIIPHNNPELELTTNRRTGIIVVNITSQ